MCFATQVSAWTYLLNQAPILLDYVRLAFWPVHLVLDYGVPRPVTLSEVLLPLIVIGALVVIAAVLLVRRSYAGFLGAWCFITLSPTSSIVPIATEVGAERRMYLALAGLVTLSSLFSTLIEHRQTDQTTSMDMAQVVQQGPGLSGSKGPVAASTIH